MIKTTRREHRVRPDDTLDKEKIKLMNYRLQKKTELLKEIESERKDLWADYHKRNGEEEKKDDSNEDKG